MKNRNNAQALQALLSQMGNGSFEDSNFEDMKFSLNEVAQAVRTNGAMGANGMVKHIGSNVGSAAIEALIMQSVGDLNLTVTRTGVNINSPLPFILFGVNDFASGYTTTIAPLLAQVVANHGAAVTVAVTTSAAGDIVFTYTAAAGIDTVTVSAIGNINYRTILSSMLNNFFTTKYFGVTTGDTANAPAQYAQPLLFGELSSLGMTRANQLTFRSRQFSWNFLANKCEVVLPEQTIAPSYSFAMNIIQVAGYTIGFDFFMAQRTNLNKLG